MRIGRSGWKSQTVSALGFRPDSLRRRAGARSAGTPSRGLTAGLEAAAKGLDLNAQECESRLVVSTFPIWPRPAERKPESEREAKEIEVGRGLFAMVGCSPALPLRRSSARSRASTADLRSTTSAPRLGDVGQYGVFDPSSSEDEIVDDPGSVAGITSRSPRRRMMVSGMSPFGAADAAAGQADPRAGSASADSSAYPALWGIARFGSLPA